MLYILNISVSFVYIYIYFIWFHLFIPTYTRNCCSFHWTKTAKHDLLNYVCDNDVIIIKSRIEDGSNGHKCLGYVTNCRKESKWFFAGILFLVSKLLFFIFQLQINWCEDEILTNSNFIFTFLGVILSVQREYSILRLKFHQHKETYSIQNHQYTLLLTSMSRITWNVTRLSQMHANVHYSMALLFHPDCETSLPQVAFQWIPMELIREIKYVQNEHNSITFGFDFWVCSTESIESINKLRWIIFIYFHHSQIVGHKPNGCIQKDLQQHNGRAHKKQWFCGSDQWLPR